MPTLHALPSRRSALTSFGALLGSALTLHPARALDRPSLVSRPLQDHWTAFWPIYLESRSLSAFARASHLMQHYFAPRMAIYEAAELRHVDVVAVIAWLAPFDHIAQDVFKLHQRFSRDYDGYANRFRKNISDFDSSRSPVTLVPSLMNFDAHLVPNGGGLPLYFGLDGIVAIHGNDPDLAVLFSHEIFHCYQGQRNPKILLKDKLPVFAGLWIEGGATWVSAKFNPSASPGSILLDDQALLNISPQAMRAALLAISERFNSLEDADTAAFFTVGYKGPWPARVGYLVGLMIARDVAPSMPINEFASMSLPSIELLYRRSLNTLIATSKIRPLRLFD